MGLKVEISDIVHMIRECAPDATMRVATHSILVKRGEHCTRFSKGEGAPKTPDSARGQEHARVVRKVAELLAISPACVNHHFPGLLECEAEVAAAPKARDGNRPKER